MRMNINHITSIPHRKEYRKLYVKRTMKCSYVENGNVLQYDFEKNNEYHMIQMVDIHIKNEKNHEIDEIINGLECYFGGYMIDKISVKEDFKTQLQTCAILYEREIRTINNVTIVPFVLSPFHKTNITEPSTKYHTLQIRIRTPQNEIAQKIFDDCDDLISIWGTTYTFLYDDYIPLKDNYSMNVYQQQYTGKDKLVKGINNITLNFVYPLYCIYFWGCDMTKIQNVRLMIDGSEYCNMTISELRDIQYKLGYCNTHVCMIFFSSMKMSDEKYGCDSFNHTSYNKLIITTEQDESDIYIVAVVIHPMLFVNGYVGLCYNH